MEFCKAIISSINRRKHLGGDQDLYATPLHRTLTTFQLSVMGVGSMIGAGLFVLTGVEAKEVTGPAIVISYAVATVSSIISALCYVEFASRIPQTGSAYTFTYVAVGEVWAFLIGWNLILEYAIAAASVSSSFMGYMDSLTGYRISNFTIETIMGGHVWDQPHIATYPNIFAAVLLILISLFIASGTRASFGVTFILMANNMIIIVIIIVMGFVKADIKNWQNYGGFVPNGPASVVAGAATLFYSFVGFDTIAMANEEALNPRKSIPRATFIAIMVTSLCYILSSAALTLMVPYTQLDEQSAFAAAFQQRGIEWARWLVGVGALCCMFTTIVMSLYSLPRSMYAMSSDGLLFEFLSRVNEYTKVPLYAVLVSAILAIIPALFFSLGQLVEFLSIGVLLGYAFVAAAVILLRYGPDDITADETAGFEMQSQDYDIDRPKCPSKSPDDNARLLDATSPGIPGTLKQQFHATPLLRELNRLQPGVAVKISLLGSIFFQFCTLSLVEYASSRLLAAQVWAIFLLIFFIFGTLLPFGVITLHYQNADTNDYYRVPCVPLIPWLGIFINVMLLLKLRGVTWIRFLVWITVGLIIYAAYGYRHSKTGQVLQQRNSPSQDTPNSNRSTETVGTYGSTQLK